MRMTKTLEKKIIDLCNKYGIETNIDWNVGHCDFSFNGKPLGSVRWFGYMYDLQNKDNRNKIYVATCWTKLVFTKNCEKLIWDSNCNISTAYYYTDTSDSEHKDMFFNNTSNYTPKDLFDFLNDCFYRVLNANKLEKLKNKLNSLKEDF